MTSIKSSNQSKAIMFLKPGIQSIKSI